MTSDPATLRALAARLAADANSLKLADVTDPWGLQLVGEDVVRLHTELDDTASALDAAAQTIERLEAEVLAAYRAIADHVGIQRPGETL